MQTSLPHCLTRAGLCLASLLPLAGHAQAPANDDPLGAIALPLSTTCTPTSATNAGATTTTPNGYTNPGCGIATAPKDVWFRFRTPAAGNPGSTAAAIAVTGTAAGQVRLFSTTVGGAGPFTAVACSNGGSNNAQAARLVAAGLTPSSTYYVAVSGYGSADAQGAFTICASVPVANDAAVESVLTLTQLPIPPGAPHVVRAVVSNQGATAQTNLPVTLTVTGANPFTNTQTVASLAAGASTTVSFVSFTPTVAGTNTLAVTVPADDDNTNNSRNVAQEVNATTYSYAAPGGATGAFQLGIGVTDMAFACRYRINSPVSVTQIRSYVVNFSGLAGGQPGSSIGKTVYGILVDQATGAVLARSNNYVLAPADINSYVTLDLRTQVPLPAGTDVLVGMVAVYPPGQTVNFAPFGVQIDEPGRKDAFYVVSATSFPLPQPLNSNTGGYKRLMIEAVTAPAIACPRPASLSATALTPNGATLTFTPPTGGSGSYSLTYFGSVQPATTMVVSTSSVSLSGLVAGATYTASVAASCGSGQASYPAFVNFTTPPPAAAAYATLPVNEGFEGPWLSVGAVRDAPSNNWRNTPASGNQSWRREDDGASANWLTNLGVYPGGGSQSAHSARFNSYDAPLGTTGTLDLYVNLSAAGAKTLTFDYINLSGTDVLDVLVSTDGGATFGPAPVLTVGVSPTITRQTATIASTSATTVIRFRATSDYGPATSDIGIDNVQLALVSATRNEALAATVGLYPNPAHGSFTLAVPAGPLGAASATLLNALGQVVQARPLHLPATGGTAEFNLRGLTPGVYSLRLQTGEALVMKRVVVE
ncbi:fibronectin type III domain-containing protein [Hymenobacter properus]|uniref:T9SS type A sorting domain-containing protein n=1 Tax=Hymenobacter properus TaxID=2791026 RepID=A0A931FLH1_9BACT|nr:T9SS type A sorting domain-containing protein [Hymenobacter properus]MBF9142860.1 T9SS type A sorting domain-containing protein [Hymenobacter properus]MBR7721667.1 T9SS type A sorting domain-containing protein [Microvirga sp. SRT04]